ncbi:MAG TPA: hypothetical protein VNO79_07070 [Actinomycetota bacterium]|nr:hypothetical protein [Actinomycetota bacterium]
MDVPRPPDCRACGAALGPGADWCWRCLAPILVRLPDAELLAPARGGSPRAWALALALALVAPAAALSWAWVRTAGVAGLPLGLLVVGAAAAVAALVPRLARVGRHPTVVFLPGPRRVIRIDGPPVERRATRRPAP